MNLQTSVSRFTSLARCGLAYELERVQGLPPLPAGWSIQGVAVHDALDRWEKSHRKMPEGEVLRAYNYFWRRQMQEAEARFPDRSMWLAGGRKKPQQDLVDRYEAGKDQIIRYIRYNLSDERLQPFLMPDGSVAAEVGFSVEKDGVEVRGYIDLILFDTETGQLLVRDIKTGRKPPAVPFQLVVYRMAVQEIFGEDIRWGHFFMTRDGAPTEPIDITTLDEDFLWTWFTRSVRMAEQGLFIPNPGESTCRTCAVSIHCPLMRRSRDD